MKNDMKIYYSISELSVWIRTFLLPNPFEVWGVAKTLSIGEFQIPVPTLAINIICGQFILYPAAFLVTKKYYTKGVDSPVKGSVIFLLFYCIFTGLVYLMSMAKFAKWAIISIIMAYIVLHCLVHFLVNKIKGQVVGL
jgi:hypothetical protein